MQTTRAQLQTAVIVPTLNEERNIGAALEAILAGVVRPDELVVVDGGSQDRTVEIARSYPTYVLNNPKIHAAAARNVGLAHTRADIVAFTDADCLPQADWLDRIKRRFSEDPTLMGVGGRLVPHPRISPIEAFSAHVFIDEVMGFSSAPAVHQRPGLRNGLITANCAYRREALVAAGGFRDAFANFGEDLDVMWRMLDRYKLAYDPELVVMHRFPSTRKGLSRKYVQYGIASSLLTRHYLGSPRVDWSLYRKLGTSLLNWVARPRLRPTASLYIVQLSSHLVGKWIGCFRYRVVNL